MKYTVKIKISILNQVEILLLQGIGKNVTYEEISLQHNYSCAYLTNVAAPKLYKKLSGLLEDHVTKKNCLILLKKYFSSIEKNTLASYPSGAVVLNSPFYIDRPLVDDKVYQEIENPGALIRIKAAREMGKTSLLVRILDHAVGKGYQTVTINCTQIDDDIFSNLDRFLRFLCATVTQQLQLESKLDEYWDEDIGNKVSCSLYFRYYILEKIDAPIVLAFDELNIIFEYPQVAKDVLPLLRSWYEDGKRTSSWHKLRQIVMHSTEVYIPLQLNQSPFNVGLPIQLSSFDLSQVQKLAEKYQLNWQSNQDAERLTNLLGGHPALIQIALYYLSRQEITLEELLQTAANSEGIFRNHLRRQWLNLQQDPRLIEIIRVLLKSEGSLQLEPNIAYKLSSMGLIKQIANEARISCELYRIYFTKHLL